MSSHPQPPPFECSNVLFCKFFLNLISVWPNSGFWCCFGNKSFMQLMGRLSMRSWTIQFFVFLFWRGRGRGIFCVFSLVLNDSHHVPPRVPKCVPQDVPNTTWVLSHMICPKFNSHVYKLKRWNLGVCILGVQRGAGMHNVPKKLGQSTWLLKKF